MTDKRDLLLEIAVFLLALIAIATLDAADTVPALILVPGYFSAMGVAAATGLLVLYEVATFDV